MISRESDEPCTVAGEREGAGWEEVEPRVDESRNWQISVVVVMALYFVEIPSSTVCS